MKINPLVKSGEKSKYGLKTKQIFFSDGRFYQAKLIFSNSFVTLWTISALLHQ